MHELRFDGQSVVVTGAGRRVGRSHGTQPELTSYGAAKGAIWAFTRNIVTEGPEFGIQANAVAPRALMLLSLDGRDPSEVGDSLLARMDPDLVAPVAAYLAHESCTLNGEVLVAGGGDVFDITPVVSQGIAKDHLTIEDVAEHVDAIMSTADAKVPPIGTYVR